MTKLTSTTSKAQSDFTKRLMFSQALTMWRKAQEAYSGKFDGSGEEVDKAVNLAHERLCKATVALAAIPALTASEVVSKIDVLRELLVDEAREGEWLDGRTLAFFDAIRRDLTTIAGTVTASPAPRTGGADGAGVRLLRVVDSLGLELSFCRSILQLILDHGNGADQDRFATSHDSIISALVLVDSKLGEAHDLVNGDLDGLRQELKQRPAAA